MRSKLFVLAAALAILISGSAASQDQPGRSETFSIPAYSWLTMLVDSEEGPLSMQLRVPQGGTTPKAIFFNAYDLDGNLLRTNGYFLRSAAAGAYGFASLEDAEIEISQLGAPAGNSIGNLVLWDVNDGKGYDFGRFFYLVIMTTHPGTLSIHGKGNWAVLDQIESDRFVVFDSSHFRGSASIVIRAGDTIVRMQDQTSLTVSFEDLPLGLALAPAPLGGLQQDAQLWMEFPSTSIQDCPCWLDGMSNAEFVPGDYMFHLHGIRAGRSHTSETLLAFGDVRFPPAPV